MNKPAAVFLDSGIGGLPYLAWVKNQRPNLAVSYLADTAHFPYGELSSSRIIQAAAEAAQLIQARLNPSLIAVVCNTASVNALEEIRRTVSCPVVGTVPAVKPAAQESSTKPIGILATQGTVNSPYLNSLIAAYAPHREIVRAAAGDIVRYVEEDWLDDSGIGARDVMQRALGILKQAEVETVVIGCTHFLHVAEIIQDMLGGVRLIDSREGVGRRILSLLDESSPVSGEDHFYVSRSAAGMDRYRRFAELYGLKWMGELT
ncbi:MAG: glutamate racemase [Spirochaeta sp. LUC14_002_19_P3]|nr:MAG: glutamate racemase [Spirochaeta sp. LUC14_002_19_P3]